MKTKKTRGRIGIFLRWFFVVWVLALCLGAVAVGERIRREFDRELPAQFRAGSATSASPTFYIYRFSDRVNRVGEAEEWTAGTEGFPASESVSYPELPTHLVNAFVAIEDKRFFEHHGVDWYRTIAATGNYLLGRGTRFGGSTITQQLVKNLTGDRAATPKRKIQEIFYALELERDLDKTEILERYLNVIHFSDHCDGIAAAAEHYFSKRVSELSVAESATLAAIVNSPSYYNPVKHPENNLERRNLILSEMFAQGYLDGEEYRAALSEPLGLALSASRAGESVNSWYLDMATEDIVNDLTEKYDMSRAAAYTLLQTGGLRIDLAMDPEIQEAAEEYYRTVIRLPENGDGVRAQSSMILLDAGTGDILAVVGAAGQKTGNRLQNFATQTLRPPGSTIKPLSVYAPALEMGLINWASVYDDVPLTFNEETGTAWPKNANGVYRGLTNVAYAVAHSTNTVALRILSEVGLETSFRFAKEKFHLNHLISDERGNDCDLAALGLGQLNYGVTLREMTAAYTVFADAGVYHPWRSYYRVTDAEGRILLSAPDAGEAVLSPANAAIMTKLLCGVVESGTSDVITLSRVCECAGKTGTTNKDGDRWFIGYTPEVVCGVWCGYEYPEPLLERNICTSAWNGVMRRVVEIRGGKRTFDLPSSVVRVRYCRDSGCLLSSACEEDPRGSRAETGWFLRGQEPTRLCRRHVLCDYDTMEGGVCHSLMSADAKKVALIRVERVFPFEVTVSDAQFVYRGNPVTFPPNPDPSSAYYAKTVTGYCGKSDAAKQFNRSHVPKSAPEPEEPPDAEREDGGEE